MDNSELTREQQYEAHLAMDRACMRLVVEDLGGADEASVRKDLGRYSVHLVEYPDEAWRNAEDVFRAAYPGLVLRPRFRKMPYWSVCRFFFDEYHLAHMPAHQRPHHYQGGEPDNPQNLVELASVHEWLEADGASHPQIRRYIEMDDDELKVLCRQQYLYIPSRLSAAAYDAGWLGGRPWDGGLCRPVAEAWMNRLASEKRLAHFYCWLKELAARDVR